MADTVVKIKWGDCGKSDFLFRRMQVPYFTDKKKLFINLKLGKTVEVPEGVFKIITGIANIVKVTKRDII